MQRYLWIFRRLCKTSSATSRMRRHHFRPPKTTFILSPEALTPIPEEQTSDHSPFANELPVFSAGDSPSVGAKRSQIFLAAFSPIEDDISIPEDHTSTPEEETADISPLSDDLPGFSAEYCHMAGRKRSRNFPAPPTRQVLLKSQPPLI